MLSILPREIWLLFKVSPFKSCWIFCPTDSTYIHIDPITKNSYKRDSWRPITLYFYFRVRNWFSFLLVTCLSPNSSELACLWRFVTSSIIHYCHRFRTVEYFSAHSIRNFVLSGVHPCISMRALSLPSWLNLILFGCPLRLEPLHITRTVCLLLRFLRPLLSDTKKTQSS